jgi:hypothetical protein
MLGFLCYCCDDYSHGWFRLHRKLVLGKGIDLLMLLLCVSRPLSAFVSRALISSFRLVFCCVILLPAVRTFLLNFPRLLRVKYSKSDKNRRSGPRVTLNSAFLQKWRLLSISISPDRASSLLLCYVPASRQHCFLCALLWERGIRP